MADISAPLCYLPAMTSLSGTFLPLWLWRNLPAYAPLHTALFRRRPGAYLGTLVRAAWMGIRYRKHAWGGYRKVFIKEFLQAGAIAEQVMRRQHVGHLHAHFCHGATTVALFASRLSGIPFSFTAHAKDIYQKTLNPGDLLQRKIDQARFVTTCTGANHEHLSACAHESKVHTIYHGLDVDRFRPDPGARDAETPVRILAVGRYVEKKGFHILLEACEQLRRKGVAFHCHLVGEHGDQYARLQTLVERLGLGGQVTLDGARTHEALLPIYQRSHIFALPCQVLENGDRDGIPNVLMEAMACGLAVVSTPISGIPELVTDGEDGLLTPQKNSTALCNALERLIRDREERRRLGDNARRTILRAFDARATNRQLKRLFDACLEQRQGTRDPAKISEIRT
ncbi:MAG TPA: colanic acid biosynthesis glycosyltransferase WcaL [Chromatiaceae bacterium]|nr:colanic acid biosynthesis glycosyltransferase WcaL [Chromatiaceae bacterium]